MSVLLGCLIFAALVVASAVLLWLVLTVGGRVLDDAQPDYDVRSDIPRGSSADGKSLALPGAKALGLPPVADTAGRGTTDHH